MLQKLLQQQQQQQQSTQPLWGGLAKQSPSLKALLELQQESERHLQKPAQPRAQQRAVSGPWTSRPAYLAGGDWGGSGSAAWGSGGPLEEGGASLTTGLPALGVLGFPAAFLPPGTDGC